MKLSRYTLLLPAFLAACTPPVDTQHSAQDTQIAQMAENLKRSGDTAGAVRMLREADTTYPNDPLILSQLGYALIASGQPQEAVSVFDRLITLRPDNVSAYNGKAVALDRTGNHTNAQELYRQALKLSPDSLSIKNNLAMSMILGDQTDQAITLLEELNRQSNNQTIRQNLALAYGLKGDKDKALAINLQDLPEAEAQENLRFYEQYAAEHKQAAVPGGKAPKVAASVPPIPAMSEKTPVVTAAPAIAVPFKETPAVASEIPAAPVQIKTEDKAENAAPAVTAAKPETPVAATQLQPEDKAENAAPAMAAATPETPVVAAQPQSEDNAENKAPLSSIKDWFHSHLTPDADENAAAPAQNKPEAKDEAAAPTLQLPFNVQLTPDADTTYPSKSKPSNTVLPTAATASQVSLKETAPTSAIMSQAPAAPVQSQPEDKAENKNPLSPIRDWFHSHLTPADAASETAQSNSADKLQDLAPTATAPNADATPTTLQLPFDVQLTRDPDTTYPTQNKR